MDGTHDPGLAPPEDSISMPPLCHEIRDIEREISRHEKIIIDLKVKRNSRLPIFQLPAEILCIIVHHTQDRNTDTLTWGRIRLLRDELPWITITHVCKRWRDVALNEPSLWTIPPLRNPKWAALMLQRSQMAGVTLFLNQESIMRHGAMEIVVPHIGHTEKLIVERVLNQATMERLLAHLESIPSPMLQKLVLRGQEYKRSEKPFGLDDVRPRLRRDALLQSVNLRHLSLVAVDVDWSSRMFSESLTTLTISNVSDGTRPSPSQFMDALQAMPNLAALSLEDALPKHTTLAQTDSRWNDRRVCLSALKDLRIVSETTECEFLWNHISTSSAISHVSVVATFSPRTSSSFATLLGSIYGSDTCLQLENNSRSVSVSVVSVQGDSEVEMSPFVASEDLTLHITNNGSTRDIGIANARHPDHSAESSEFGFNITAKGLPASTYREGQPSSNIIFQLYHYMRWNELRELDLSSGELWLHFYSTVLSQTLASTFGTLYGVQTVTAGNFSAKPLIEALLMGSEKEPTASPNSIAFRGLHFLMFREVAFDLDNSHRMTSELLRDCLMSRYERGVEIHGVSITDCLYFGPEEVRLLEEIVVDVHWDRHFGAAEHYLSDDSEYDYDNEFYLHRSYDSDSYSSW